MNESKAIGYTRVSTRDQAESGASLASQRTKIEAYAVLHDLELVEVIEDAGYSAKSLDRPGMTKLLRDSNKTQRRGSSRSAGNRS